MQKDINDVNNMLSDDQLHEMEEHRVEQLNAAGIDEHQVLKRAEENQNKWSSYFGENITRGKDDVNFCIRDQWTAVERSEFSRLFKPAMTFNKLYDSTKKVVSEQRKNKPDLIVRSINGKCGQEQIDLRSDLVRTIAYQSQTDLVYQTAFKSALMMGYGAFQVMIDYETPRSFNKVIKYDIIPDPTLCAWDPVALKPHKGDGNYCSRRYVMSRDEFFATYPYVNNPVSFVDPNMILDTQYQTHDTITINDEFVKEWYPLTILYLSNGMSVTEDEWEEAQRTFHEQQKIVEGSIVARIIENNFPSIQAKRQTQDYRIMHYRMIRNQIIDFSEWPSRQLPIPFVDGDSYYIEGRQYTKSFIHEARDAQKCVNFFNSEIAAEVKNRRREQWLGTPDNIKGYEQNWRNPETQTGILMAQPDPKTGQMPMKQSPWDLSPALMANAQRATQDIKEILGFSEAEELSGRDISGKARRERKLEGGMAAYVFFDNLNQAIEQGGRIVNDLLPYIVGHDERHMVVSKPDGKTSAIILNHKQKDGNVKNVLDEGEFDVEIDTGPSFAVQKDIALEFFQQTLAAQPQAFPLVADLWAKNLDVQYMPQLVERFKTMVPPAIIAKENGEPPPPPQPNPQEQMAQMEMQMKQQEMQNKQAELAMKQQQIQQDQQQHEIDKVKLQQDAYKMMHDIQMDKDKNDVQKAKLIAELTKITAGSHDKEMDRHLDHHKHSKDHDHKMITLLADVIAKEQAQATQSAQNQQNNNTNTQA